MKLRTIIIDDEPIALEKLRMYAGKVPFIELVGEFDSSLEALSYMTGNPVDLVFTDINMPDLSGMELVETLNGRAKVVFTTAYAEHAVDSYRLSATDYLLKPYSFADFLRAATKALESSHGPEGLDSIFVKTDSRYIRVHPRDIRYVKGYGEYLQVFLTGEKQPLLTLSSFAAIMERLPSNFLQVHRSYIVNMEQVERVERQRIIMDEDTYIPVSDSYRDSFNDYLQSRSIGKK